MGLSMNNPMMKSNNATVTSNSKKVAFIATVYRHLEAFHLPYMKLLQDKGYEVHAYARPDHGKTGVVERGVICHDIPFERNPLQIDNLRALHLLTSNLRQEGFEMVHVNTPVAGILGRLAAKRARIPNILYTAHGFHFFKGAPFLYWLFYYPCELLMARWTDHLITINQEDYQRAQKFPVRRKVNYVPGVGIDTGLFQFQNESEMISNKRNELGIGENDFVILCVAELIPRKNQMQLIRAVEQLVNNGKSVKSMIVGSGADELRLKAYVKERDLESHVHFLGFRRDIPELFAISDVFTLLSKHEGLTKALMEAMAAGKPIVTTDVRGNRDLTIEGENGFLVPVSDVNATVEALMKLIDHPEMRIEMGKRNRERSKQYEIGTILKNMEQIYSSSLEVHTS